MSPVAKETYSRYLPPEGESDIVQATFNSELEEVTGWIAMKIRSYLIDYLFSETSDAGSVIENCVDLAEQQLKIFLREGKEARERLDALLRHIHTKTEPSMGALDYTMRDEEKLHDRQRALSIRDAAIINLINDKDQLRGYVQALFDSVRDGAVVAARDIDQQKKAEGGSEVRVDTGELNLELIQLLGDQATKKTSKLTRLVGRLAGFWSR